jgi:predicted anti-sigma-YlaC factor YlaD
MNGRTHRRWTSKLSDYLDGGLTPAERTVLQAHLDGCAGCRTVLEELRGLASAAREMGGLAPPRDLWPGIEAAIREGAPAVPDAEAERRRGRKVITLPTAGGRRPERRRAGIVLTAPQLAAAAVVLVAVSVAATRWAGPGTPATDVPVASEEARSPLSLAADVPAPPASLAAELSMLEDQLAAVRDALDPNTLRVLERNMAVIERAIEDSRQALALEPGNEFLSRHLEQVYERKLDYLREAAAIADWAG